MIRAVSASLLMLTASAAAPGSPLQERYTGMCDASAAVMLDDERFVVANDEDNVLRIYRLGDAKPIGTLDLSTFLGTGKDEADIEGATRLGSRIFWITSHGANRSGKPRPARHRLFATDIVSGPNGPSLAPVGIPYTRLIEDLAALPELAADKDVLGADLAPEAGGVNIEGLATAPDGSLVVAFRSPVRDGQALTVFLTNPNEILTGGPGHAHLGAVRRIVLDGMGIRSIEAVPGGRDYLLVAGPVAAGAFAMFRWDPQSTEKPPRLPVDFGGLAPEAMALRSGHALMLSDDGDELVDGVPCKDEKVPAARKSFRAFQTKLSQLTVIATTRNLWGDGK
jgi:hypothetical protein